MLGSRACLHFLQPTTGAHPPALRRGTHLDWFIQRTDQVDVFIVTLKTTLAQDRIHHRIIFEDPHHSDCILAQAAKDAGHALLSPAHYLQRQRCTAQLRLNDHIEGAVVIIAEQHPGQKPPRSGWIIPYVQVLEQVDAK